MARMVRMSSVFRLPLAFGKRKFRGERVGRPQPRECPGCKIAIFHKRDRTAG
jgi:hypothetical protein